MNDSVQQIKNRLNILDVVGTYVELHKSGRNFKGKSPFTQEKTPSFYVSPDRGMYYCFSTSQGGDMFTFIEAMEGVDFKGALKILAEKAGVELVAIAPEKLSQLERERGALEAATSFLQEQLVAASAATEYLKKRGVSKETIALWRIGFAPGPPLSGWRETKEQLEKLGFSLREIQAVGLIKSADGGKEPYDVFRNRVMFPLFDPGGRVVGFSGRTLESGHDIPKYVNSPETEYYKKSELLYGYDKAKHGIRRFDFSLIVEGQFDVVLCHQAGYTNTVAVSGTALTLNHVQLLERLSNRVVLALDADRAGIAAVRRSADVMLRRGLDVKVAEMPLGSDPADLILSDPKAFKKIIGASVHVIEFLLHVLKTQNLDERTFKLRAREEILPYILLLPNKIDQEHFEQKVAEVLGTSADAVHFEVERFRESGKYNASPNNDLPLSAAPARGKELVEYEQRYQSLLVYLLGAIDELAPQVVERVKLGMSQITSLTYDELLEKTPISARAEVALKVGVQLSEYPKRVFEEEFVHTLNQLRTIVIRQKLKEAKDSLKTGEMLGAEKKEEEWLVKVAALQKELQATGFSQTLFD